MTMWQFGKVVEAFTEAPGFRSLGVEVPGWEGHRPGQYMSVRVALGGGYYAIRDYSIASPPEAARPVLTIERAGEGGVSAYLVDRLRVGDQLELCGPFGEHFTWESQMGGPLFLVAGGSGIVPLMSMIRHKIAVGSAVPTRLLYSSRSREETLYQSELDSLATNHGSLWTINTFTGSPPPEWGGYRRRIDSGLLEEVAWPPEERPLNFISGPTTLVERAATKLLALGHDPARVKTEYFG